MESWKSAAWLCALSTVLCGVGMAPGIAEAGATVDNDACVAAFPVGDGIYNGTTTGATPDGADSCGGTGSGDVWYLYTASCDGALQVSTCGSPLDTVISVESPGCTGSEETCNDDNDICGRQSLLRLPVAAGEQKLIRVSAWGGASGDYTLSLSCYPPVDNDACDDATPLSVGSSVLGSTGGASLDESGIQYACVAPANQPDAAWAWKRVRSPGVWYTVVGTGNRMVATTCNPGTTLDTVVGVYCDACEKPICVAGDDNTGWAATGFIPECEIAADPGYNAGSTVEWCSKPGQVYRILVFGSRFGDYGGDFELSVTDSGSPCWGAVDCAPVEVAQTFLADNGDNDGWADTLETVRMRASLFNRSGTDLTNVTARLTTDDPRIACVADSVVALGDIAAGETLLTEEAFAFRVADVERTRAAQDFTGRLKLILTSDQFQDLESPRCSVSGEPCAEDSDCINDDLCQEMSCSVSGLPCTYYLSDCAEGEYCEGTCSRSGAFCADHVEVEHPGYGRIMGCAGPDVCVDESREVRLDLDLDAQGGDGPTVFFEGFESGGFGQFTSMHLDYGLASYEASDGYRCQIYNPDSPRAFNGDCGFGQQNPEHVDTFYWQVEDDRAYSGVHSLYMGVELDRGERTTPAGTLEAVASGDPINLGWARACSSSGTSCADAGDCPSGEACLAAAPELTFKHQANLLDCSQTHGIICRIGQSLSHGVVQAQPVNATGSPLGPWRNLEPYRNGYHVQPESYFYGCLFDPLDDGNTEDDFFDPDNPLYGPSSVCHPQYVFSRAGQSRDPFTPDGVGMADGPGLRGASGDGTWVESNVDLSPFRGQRIRLRFLFSSFGIHGALPVAVYDEFSWGHGSPVDDGWWIDDVTVTHTVVDAVNRVVDTKDNTALALDSDGDCYGNVSDCAPSDARFWDLPDTVRRLRLAHTGGVGGTTTLSWTRPQVQGGTEVSYFAQVRGPGFCHEADVGGATTTTDAATPAPGELHTFLVRARNDCGDGPFGPGAPGPLREDCP